MGYSIEKVFRPIENEMKKYAEVDSVELPIPNHKLKGLYYNIKYVRNLIFNKQYDIVHITGSEYYLIPFLRSPFLRSQKVVVTIHDIGFFVNERDVIKKIWKYIMFVFPLNFAIYKFFISDKSRRECANYLMLRSNSVVIPNCVEDKFKYKENIIHNKPVILQIGTKKNKNIPRVIEALKGLDVHFRIIGKLDKKTKDLLKCSNIDFSNTCGLTDEEILKEYYNCNIVSFPSLYEGFGMPIIEGQATGRVVVTSDIKPMNEIAGPNSVILVNPYSINSIRNGFVKAIGIPLNVINLGIINSSRFSVKNISKLYYNIYNSI